MDCKSIPQYDSKDCDHTPSDRIFRVFVRGHYVQVCENAYRFAKSRRMITSLGTIRNVGGSIGKKRPAIRLNHK